MIRIEGSGLSGNIKDAWKDNMEYLTDVPHPTRTSQDTYMDSLWEATPRMVRAAIKEAQK